MERQLNISTLAPACAKPGDSPGNLLTSKRYDAALALLHPLLRNPETRNGAGFYRALNQLQKAYPDLSGNEIEALVTAVLRGLQNRGGKET